MLMRTALGSRPTRPWPEEWWSIGKGLAGASAIEAPPPGSRSKGVHPLLTRLLTFTFLTTLLGPE